MKRRYLRAISKISVFFSLITLALVGYHLIWGNWLKVDTIIIDGDQKIIIPEKLTGKNLHILNLNQEEVTNEILSLNPWVERISINKRWWRTLYLTVFMRLPVVKFVRDGQMLYIDKSGKVLPPRIDSPNVSTYIECQIDEAIGDNLTQEILLKTIRIVARTLVDGEAPLNLRCTDSDIHLDFPETTVVIDSTKSEDELVASLLFLFKQFRIEGIWPLKVDLRFEKPVLQINEFLSPDIVPESSTNNIN